MERINAQTEVGSVEMTFVAFVPLSSWLAGFDRYAMRYSKEDLPKTYPGRLYMLDSSGDTSAGMSKARALSDRIGSGPDVAWFEARLPVGAGAMEPNRWTGTGIGWGWPGESAPILRCGIAKADGSMEELRHEELTARAFAAARGEGSMDWDSCAPRTFSVLPIAMACQARCAFCFSKASASEAARQRPMDLDLAMRWARRARKAGALRAVVTGGGEPTLMSAAGLEELCAMLSREVGKTMIITNGAAWGALGDAELSARMEALAAAGLARVALSRHGVGARAEARIMGIEAGAARVARAAARAGMAVRSICVLQKDGVDSAESIRAYVEAMAREGVSEICFKELYVSSLSENRWAPSRENQYAAERQAPLSMAIGALGAMGLSERSRLPWGAPVLGGTVAGVEMSIAAYTEPSVGWELKNKEVRSLNLMSDGSCLASLEDPGSRLFLDGQKGGRLGAQDAECRARGDGAEP